MSNYSTDLMITIKNLPTILTEVLCNLPNAELNCTRRRAWSCPSCGSQTALIQPASAPQCACCNPNANARQHELSAQWHRFEVRHDGRLLMSVVVVKKSVAITETGEHYALGDSATDFERAARAVLSAAGLTRDGNGIWRFDDGSRVDRLDHVDLVFGNVEGIWTAAELARWAGYPAPSDATEKAS